MVNLSDEINLEVDVDVAKIKLLEMSVALANILPIYKDEHRKFCRGAFGYDLADIMPAMFLDMGRLAMKNPEEALGYVLWIKQATEYIIGQRKTFPDMAASAQVDIEIAVKKQIAGLSKQMRDIYEAHKA